jgi:hypothetical protein
MRRLIELLLNVKPSSWTDGGSWRLEWLSLPQHDLAFVFLLAIFFVAWLVWFVYLKEGRNLDRMSRYSLVFLRLIVLAGVLVMLLEPVLVFSKTEYVPSVLLVARDASASMDVSDAYVDESHARAVATALQISGGPKDLREKTRWQIGNLALNQTLLDKLASNGDRIVRRYNFASHIFPDAATQPSGSPKLSAVDRSATAIGAAIRQTIAANQGQPIAGILLLTDGQSNAGESPAKSAEFAAAEGVPVVPIALGTAEGPRTARITRIDVSPVVFTRDPSSLHILVESRGMAHTPAAAVLERSRDGGAWEEIGRQPIVLEENGQLQTAGFNFQEDRPTHLRLRARLEDAGPELRPDDHTAIADVRVIRDRIRVLFIAGETFPEVEFIRAMLLRDTHISASTWLQTADPSYEQPGDPRLQRLPETSEELNDYDCIILYDPDPSLWPANYPQLLQDFVAKAGGGLIFVAGERNTKNLYDRPDDPAVAWLNLLPVTVEPGLYQTDATVKLSTESPWKLDISAEGKQDPIFTFSDRSEENDNVLANLPGMFWYFPVTRARPGATVLARHGDPRMRNEYGEHVLLATQLVGPGRTFFCAFDSTYRWRYLDDAYFDSFWAHMIDRAGRSKQLGGRYPYSLSTDRTTYTPGTTVTLSAMFENPQDRDAGLDALHGEVQVGDDQPQQITLTPKPNDPSSFQATFATDKAGTYLVRVWAGDADIKVEARAATLEIPVELPDLEMQNPTQDLVSLQSIARATNGRVFDLSEIASIPDAFKTHRVARTLEDRQEIWNAPVIYITIVIAILTEWILRKKMRLI